MSTGISYLDEVWNICTGCSGKGCKCRDTCWAREMVKRFPMLHGAGDKEWMLSLQATIDFSTVRFHPDRLDKPLLHWKKPRRIGVCFMGDIFDEQVKPEWIVKIFTIMESCPQHQFFILTKQARNMAAILSNNNFPAYVRKFGYDWLGPQKYQERGPFWRENMWHGVSITDQEDADRMIPDLLRVPGKRWISLEPMLGPVDLNRNYHNGNFWGDLLNLVIIGCESGPRRRPCELEWIHDVILQCDAAKVPVYVKQIPVQRDIRPKPNRYGDVTWDVVTRVSHDPAEWPAWACRREMP